MENLENILTVKGIDLTENKAYQSLLENSFEDIDLNYIFLKNMKTLKSDLKEFFIQELNHCKRFRTLFVLLSCILNSDCEKHIKIRQKYALMQDLISFIGKNIICFYHSFEITINLLSCSYLYNRTVLLLEVLLFLQLQSFSLKKSTTYLNQRVLKLASKLTGGESFVAQSKLNQFILDDNAVYSTKVLAEFMQNYNENNLLKEEEYIRFYFDPNSVSSAFKSTLNEDLKIIPFSLTLEKSHQNSTNMDDTSGISGITYKSRNRFPDKRVYEVAKLLTSHLPQKLYSKFDNKLTDIQLLSQQQRKLLELSFRTLGLSIGRSMLTIHSQTSSFLFQHDLPKICLQGLDKSTTVQLNLEMPAKVDSKLKGNKYTSWPKFHNLICYSLMHQKSTAQMLSLMFGQPVGSTNVALSAALIFGRSMNSDLMDLGLVRVYATLNKSTPLVRLVVLLALSCSRAKNPHFSARDDGISKLLCLHLPPSFSIDLRQIKALTPAVQNVSLLSLGILYSRRRNSSLLVSFMLNHLKKSFISSNQQVKEIECNRLFGGFALGLCCLHSSDIEKEQMFETLYQMLKPKQKAQLSGKYSTLKDSKYENFNWILPGVLAAIGLLYFKSGNSVVLEKLVSINDSTIIYSKPTNVLLCALTEELISTELILSSPKLFKNINLRLNKVVKADLKTKLCFVSGKCLGLALKNAGSKDKNIQNLFMDVLSPLIIMSELAKIVEQDRKPKRWMINKLAPLVEPEELLQNEVSVYIIDLCLVSVCSALGIVMAGSCDLDCLKIIRRARSKIKNRTYGHHMGLNMSLGLLFLGNGSKSLANDSFSMAMLYVSFFPIWPSYAPEHKFHHQIGRFLYVLAVKDVDEEDKTSKAQPTASNPFIVN